MKFEQAIEIILKHEGGYVNHPSDPGGETNYGITKRSYPSLNIKTLTRAQAIEIYRKDFWNKNKIDNMPEIARLAYFDMSVNMGAGGAGRVLQRSLNRYGKGLTVDGIIGPKSIAALKAVTESEKGKWTLNHFLAIDRIIYYTNIVVSKPSQVVFLKGWINRANDILTRSV